MKKVDQVSAQLNVVQVLAQNISTVANELQATLREGMDESALDVIGRRSASLMDDLGNILNSMDAADEADDWMAPVFERAQAMFPSEKVTA